MNNTLQVNTSTRVTRPVVLIGDDGKESEFELRELMVSDREKYMTGMASRMAYTAEGKPSGIKNFNGSYAELLCRCMFRKKTNDAGAVDYVPVTKDEVASWPTHAASIIFAAAQEINHIGNAADEEDAAKKE